MAAAVQVQFQVALYSTINSVKMQWPSTHSSTQELVSLPSLPSKTLTDSMQELLRPKVSSVYASCSLTCQQGCFLCFYVIFHMLKGNFHLAAKVTLILAIGIHCMCSC